MNKTLLKKYSAFYDAILVPVARQLEPLIVSHLGNTPRVDRISARAKSPERFMEKAAKVDEKTGVRKYREPLLQIQDQIGARVVVYYQGDVEPVSQLLLPYFRQIEAKDIFPESRREFGYFGKHFLLAIPREAIPKEIKIARAPTVFELQIKTLFQHAWSEAEHDLGYKPIKRLEDDQVRRFAFTAAQGWGADRIFEELFLELKGPR